MIETIVAWGTSLPNELGFKAFRARLALTQNKRVSGQTAWKALADSDVLKTMGRPHVKPGEAELEPLPQLPRSSFKAMQGEPDCDAVKNLENVQYKPTGWQQFSALSKNGIPAAWSLMLEAYERNARENIALAWHSLLASTGDVLKHRASGRTCVVLSTTRFACWTWPCVGTMRGGAMTVTIPENTDPTWRTIVDPLEYEAWQVHAMPPIDCIVNRQQAKIIMEATGPSMMIHRAAANGFIGCSVPYLDKIIKEYDIIKKKKLTVKPSTMIDKVTLLVTFFLPKITSADLYDALLTRCGGEKELCRIKSSSVFADSVMDSSDKQSLRETEESHEKSSSAVAGMKEALGRGSLFLDILMHPAVRELAKPMKKPKPPTKVIVTWKTIRTVEMAQKLMPKVSGSHIHLVKAKRCWRAYYPTPKPPGSRTRTWGFAFPPDKVLKHCIKWAWAEHYKFTKEEAPWIFD